MNICETQRSKEIYDDLGEFKENQTKNMSIKENQRGIYEKLDMSITSLTASVKKRKIKGTYMEIYEML